MTDTADRPGAGSPTPHYVNPAPWDPYVSEKLTAEQAERFGLVNRVVPAGTVDEAALEVAEQIALVPPITARAVKDTINATVDRMGQRDSWRYHFMVHQVVSNSEVALGLVEQRKAGGMARVKEEQQGKGGT